MILSGCLPKSISCIAPIKLLISSSFFEKSLGDDKYDIYKGPSDTSKHDNNSEFVLSLLKHS